MSPRPIRIFGAGIRASVVVDLIGWQFADQFRVEGYYDDRLIPGGKGPGGFPIPGTFADGLAEMPRLDRWAFVAAGTRTSAGGCRVFWELRSRGVQIASLVSSAAHVSPTAGIGENALVFPGSYVGTQVRVGHLFCAHGGSVVEHHGQLGHNVLLGPGVSIASSCQIGSHSFLGAGATMIPERRVGPGTLLGAGSLMVRDIPAHVVGLWTTGCCRAGGSPRQRRADARGR
jgi:acetyltransferase EpsM